MCLNFKYNLLYKNIIQLIFKFLKFNDLSSKNKLINLMLVFFFQFDF